MSATTADPRPTTDALVRALASELTPVRRLRGVATRTALWAALAALCTALATLAVGARPDLAYKLSEPGYLAESAALLTVFIAAARHAFRLSIPGLAPSLLASTVPAAAWAIWAAPRREPLGGQRRRARCDVVDGGLPCIAGCWDWHSSPRRWA